MCLKSRLANDLLKMFPKKAYFHELFLIKRFCLSDFPTNDKGMATHSIQYQVNYQRCHRTTGQRQE